MNSKTDASDDGPADSKAGPGGGQAGKPHPPAARAGPPKGAPGPKRGAGGTVGALMAGAQGVGRGLAGQHAALVRPLAHAARMQRRHWGLAISFAALVLAPLFLVILYLGILSVNQYGSTAGFTVRQENNTSSSDILGGLAQFTGGGIASDGDILYAFIQSQEMVEAVDAEIDLRAHYTQNWPRDFAFALWPDATLEDLVWYWRRVVRVAYDSASGLTEVQVLAYDPQTAQAIGRAVVAESEARINALSEQAREDAMSYARADAEAALDRLRIAREALTEFRTRTRIVDPAADIQGRMGVMNNLQQQLAEALIAYDMLSGTTRENDPRLINARQRIDVIRDRIAIERQTFASDNTDTGAVGEDYPTLIAEYEALNVNREFAEEIYRAALMALEAARDEAARNSRYLAVYIKPTLSVSSQYPRRWVIAGLAGLFLLLVWSIGALIYYSIRDRS